MFSLQNTCCVKILELTGNWLGDWMNSTYQKDWYILDFPVTVVYLKPAITVIDTALQSAKAQKSERTTVSYFLVAFNRKIGVYFITYISQGKMARYRLSTGYRLSNILICLLCRLLLRSLSFSASSLKNTYFYLSFCLLCLLRPKA